MRTMKSLPAMAIACLIAGSAAASPPKPVPLPPMTAQKWVDDINVFARQLPRRHLNAFHFMRREDFDRAVDELRGKAVTANDDAMLTGLMQITARIGDGHTHILMPSSVHRLPVSVQQFGDDFRITAAAPEAADVLGGKMLKINGMPIADVVTRVRTVVSQDESEPFVRGALPSYLLLAEVLHGLGITSDAQHASLMVSTTSGEKTIDVSTVAGGTSPAQWPNAATTTPLMRQSPAEALFFTYLESQKTVYVAFRRYDDLAARSKALWNFVDKTAVGKIVFDLRNNGGGDNTKGRKYLVNELKSRPKLKTFVLVGNRTFSAAMNNAIDFRNDVHAVLVGQPIGEKPNSYQENDEMTLPNSKIVVSYSTRFYKFVPDDAPPIVMPDKVIEPRWEDYLAGRDAALEWVLAQ